MRPGGTAPRGHGHTASAPTGPARAPGSGEKPARATYHHGDLREALLEATLDLVARDGVAGFSLNAAARAAGVSSAAPYRHFASKDALLTEALERGFVQLRTQMQAVAESHPEDPLARLGALGAGYVAFAMDKPAAFRLLFRGTGTGTGTSPGGLAAFAVLTTCVEEAQRQGQLRDGAATVDIARAAWSLVHGLATLHLDNALEPTGLPPLDGESTAATLAVFTAGLRRS